MRQRRGTVGLAPVGDDPAGETGSVRETERSDARRQGKAEVKHALVDARTCPRSLGAF